jgi:hydroxymethylpyrimidine pyrophosphatase-like HAD family hydrolase
MLFITDLDKTIVYSGYPECYCVEYNENKEITYITEEAKKLLDILLKRKHFLLIPCTLRSFEQTKRIVFVKDKRTPIIICDNGFSVYVDGVLDTSWDKIMQSYLYDYPMQETYDKIENFIRVKNIPVSQIKSNRGAFYTIIFKNVADAEYYSAEIINTLEMSLYKIEKQGRKLYVIPGFLDKVLALRYIKDLLPQEKVITAGDSSVDLAFVREGDFSIIPSHSKLQIDNAIKTNSKGINAGEEILKLVINIVDDSQNGYNSVVCSKCEEEKESIK